ncbi:MAG: hypothetical protein HC821_01620, partial [Lewinella sp.]|nr:hypothetical protein [Lewinella sp.]
MAAFVLLGGAEGEAALRLGLLGGSFVRTNPRGLEVLISEPSHPLFMGLTDTLRSETDMVYFVGSLGAGAQVLGRMFGNPSIVLNNIQRGQVIALGYTFARTNTPKQPTAEQRPPLRYSL